MRPTAEVIGSLLGFLPAEERQCYEVLSQIASELAARDKEIEALRCAIGKIGNGVDPEKR